MECLGKHSKMTLQCEAGSPNHHGDGVGLCDFD